MLRKYRKKTSSTINAIKLDLDMPGFSYRKWGAEQFAKPGDWLVDNHGDVYTIDADSFSTTYQEIAPGVYYKPAAVYARQALGDGKIETREGATHYRAGDYIVFNDPEGRDGYAVSRDKFESMYELVAED